MKVAAPPADQVVRLPGSIFEDSFPHEIAPLEGESLFGFVMRTDFVNSLPFGTTARMVSRHATGWRTHGAASWASGSVFDLLALARLTGNDLASIRALTFMPELQRLFGRTDAPIESLGRFGGPRMAYCSDCWDERHLIRRAFLLPDVSVCVWHQRLLWIFSATAAEGAVGPMIPLSSERLAQQRDLLRVWSLVLDTGSPEVLGEGYRVIARFGRGTLTGARAVAKRRQAGRHSVETLVEALTVLQIDPDQLVELLSAEAQPKPCPNQVCPRFVEPGGKDDPLESTVESHCPICGSRFVGRRILLSFDLDHGSSRPTRNSVLKAQRRLRHWKIALRIACADLVAEGIEPMVGLAFERAGLPMNANLRAERLGLVAIVGDAARRHRLSRTEDGQAFCRIDMDDYRALMTIVRRRDWIGIVEWGQEHGVSGVYPDRIREWWHPPRSGILDPLFNGVWARRRSAADIQAVWVMAQERDPDLLSDEWLRRRLARCPKR